MDKNSRKLNSDNLPPKSIIAVFGLFLLVSLLNVLGDVGIRPFGWVGNFANAALVGRAPNLGDIIEKLQSDPPLVQDTLDRCMVIDPNTLSTITKIEDYKTVGDIKIEENFDLLSENAGGINTGAILNGNNEWFDDIQLAAELKMSYVVATAVNNSSETIQSAINFINKANENKVLPIVKLCTDTQCGFSLSSISSAKPIVDFYREINNRLATNNYRFVAVIGPDNSSQNMSDFGLGSEDYSTLINTINQVAAQLQEFRVINEGNIMLAPSIFDLNDNKIKTEVGAFSDRLTKAAFDYIGATVYETNSKNAYDLFKDSGVRKIISGRSDLKIILTEFGMENDPNENLKPDYEETYKQFCNAQEVKGIVMSNPVQGFPGNELRNNTVKFSKETVGDIASQCSIKEVDSFADNAWVNCNLDSCLYEHEYDERTIAKVCGVDRSDRTNIDYQDGASVKVVCETDENGFATTCDARKFDTVEISAPIKQFGYNAVMGTKNLPFVPTCAEITDFFNRGEYDPLNQFAGLIKMGDIDYPMPWLGSAINCASAMLSTIYQDYIYEDEDFKVGNFHPGSSKILTTKEIKDELDNLKYSPIPGKGEKSIIDERAIRLQKEISGTTKEAYLDVEKDINGIMSLNPYNPLKSSDDYEVAGVCKQTNMVYRDDPNNYVIGPELALNSPEDPQNLVWEIDGEGFCHVYARRKIDGESVIEGIIPNKQMHVSDDLTCALKEKQLFEQITVHAGQDPDTGDYYVDPTNGRFYLNPTADVNERSFIDFPVYEVIYVNSFCQTNCAAYPRIIRYDRVYKLNLDGSANLDPRTVFNTGLPVNIPPSYGSYSIPSNQYNRRLPYFVGYNPSWPINIPNNIRATSLFMNESFNPARPFANVSVGITCGDVSNPSPRIRKIYPRVNGIEFLCQDGQRITTETIRNGNCIIPEEYQKCWVYKPGLKDNNYVRTIDYYGSTKEGNIDNSEVIKNLQIPGVYDALYIQYIRTQNTLEKQGLKVVFRENIGMKFDITTKIRDGNRSLKDEYPNAPIPEYYYYKDEADGTCKLPDDKYDLTGDNPLAKGNAEISDYHYFDWLGYLDIMQEWAVASFDDSGTRSIKTVDVNFDGNDPDTPYTPLNLPKYNTNILNRSFLLTSDYGTNLSSFPLPTCDEVELWKSYGLIKPNEKLTCITDRIDNRYVDELAYFLCQNDYNLGVHCLALCPLGDDYNPFVKGDDPSTPVDGDDYGEGGEILPKTGKIAGLTCPVVDAGQTCFQGPEGKFTHCGNPGLPIDLNPSFTQNRDRRVVSPEDGKIIQVGAIGLGKCSMPGCRGDYVRVQGEVSGIIYELSHLVMKNGYTVGKEVKSGEYIADICDKLKGGTCEYSSAPGDNSIHLHVRAWVNLDGGQYELDPYVLFGDALGCNADSPGNRTYATPITRSEWQSGICSPSAGSYFVNDNYCSKNVRVISASDYKAIMDKIQNNNQDTDDDSKGDGRCGDGSDGRCVRGNQCSDTEVAIDAEEICPGSANTLCCPKKDEDENQQECDQTFCSLKPTCDEGTIKVSDDSCPTEFAFRCCPRDDNSDDENDEEEEEIDDIADDDFNLDDIDTLPPWCDVLGSSGDGFYEEFPDSEPGNAPEGSSGDPFGEENSLLEKYNCDPASTNQNGAKTYGDVLQMIKRAGEIMSVDPALTASILEIEWYGLKKQNVDIRNLYNGNPNFFKNDNRMINSLGCMGPGQFCGSSLRVFFETDGLLYDEVQNCARELGVTVNESGQNTCPINIGNAICANMQFLKYRTTDASYRKVINSWFPNIKLGDNQGLRWDKNTRFLVGGTYYGGACAPSTTSENYCKQLGSQIPGNGYDKYDPLIPRGD